MYVYSPKSLCGVLIFISVSRRLTKMFRKMVKDGVWQRCVWKMLGKMVCDKDMCERWCVTKLCVKDGVWQRCVWKMVCDQVVCERSCMKRWVWKMVYDQVVCVGWCVCVCVKWYETKMCVAYTISHTHLSHTSLINTIFHTPSSTPHLWHAPSFTHHHRPSFTHHIFVTHTTLSHTTLSHTIFNTITCGTWWHAPSLCVAGVALGDIYLHLAWQGGTLWHAPSFCVAGVALGDIYLHLG